MVSDFRASNPVTPRKNRSMKSKTEKLASAVASIEAAELGQSLRKDDVIQLRVSTADKESVKATALELDLSMTDYLLTIHRLVSEKIRKGKA